MDIGVVLALATPALVVAAVISFLRRRYRGEETGHLGFRPVSPGGNPVFAPIHFGGGEAKVEHVDEVWNRRGAAPPVPGQRGPSDITPPTP
jgi:hypothetical protein